MYNVLLNCLVIFTCFYKINCADDLFIRKDGSYEYGYAGPDSFHESKANRNNVVRGKFGGRNPKTGGIDQITYTAGPRGYRPRGDIVVRKYDLSQTPRGPIGSRDDPYFDPNEDPSYNFRFRTRTYEREEGANNRGDVKGRYSYVDDVGERHNVEYIAGSTTGFRVNTPYPDSNLRLYGRLFINGRGKPLPRGRTSIQQRGDGSYKFISAGPDQRRVESSDASGYVTGSYTYLDDKGVQRTVNYEAGPEIGYRIIKTTPNFYPFRYPDILPPEPPYFGKDEDLFDTAASGPIKPLDNNVGAGGKPGRPFDSGGVSDDYDGGFPSTTTRPSFGSSTTTRRPFGGGAGSKPSYDDDLDEDIGDLFGEDFPSSTTKRPGGTTQRPSIGGGTRPGGGISRPGGGISRPGGGISRPGGGISRPGGGISRPGSGILRPGDEVSRPGGGISRPGGDTSILGGGDEGDYDDGSYKPDDGSYGKPITRPRPGFEDGSYKPSTGDGGYKPSSSDGAYKPSTGGGGGGGYKPPRPRPTYDYDDLNDVNDDFGLFGKPTTNRPFSTRRPIHVGISSGEDDSQRRGGHTIVTNVGDKLFAVPPGVSVRAHVQAIDLLPLNAKVLSPSEQYKAETKPPDADNAESNNVISNSTITTTEEPTTTIQTTTITS